MRPGRAHRPGNARDSNIINWASEETVESYVVEVLHKKINMFELVIGESIAELVLALETRRQRLRHRVVEQHDRVAAGRLGAIERLVRAMILRRVPWGHLPLGESPSKRERPPALVTPYVDATLPKQN